jgi:Glycosyl hydrolase family 57
MNAPFAGKDRIAAQDTAALQLFSVFHLNLAFSSIEEEERARVIECCYRPLLDLAAAHGPIGIEATGFTLEEIERLDPGWIARLRDLIEGGRAELIGSGYAQVIGPLLPARAVAENLKIGNGIYRRLLGVRPKIALVNEQAYSGGLAGLYLDAGYSALLMDWDNPSAAHPEWPHELRYAPQTALGADGRTIRLLWTNTVAFQKLQRYAHGDIELQEYLAFVEGRRGPRPRALCLYASDAEIFDFRPGRYRTEEKLSGACEWKRIAAAFSALAKMPNANMAAPSELLALPRDEYSPPLRLETPAAPVPVKKQRKYNLTRWAVTGRDDIAINAACERIYRKLVEREASEKEWKTLCQLWASDYRTHITEARWKRYCAELERMETRLETSLPPAPARIPDHATRDRFIDVMTPSISARLDRRRGLSVQWLAFGSDIPVLGTLPLGHFDDIALQADWYTGDCVFERPGEPKITDLDWAQTAIGQDDLGNTIVSGRIETPLGPIEKTMRFHAGEQRLDFDISFDWKEWGKGSLRLGHITLLPQAFDWKRLVLTTHNGGAVPEQFALHGERVDHGSPVSFLVSASSGLGMTQGWASIADGKRGFRVEVDRQMAPLLGLLTHRETGGSLFCQLQLSMLELDDTRRPTPYREGPRRVRFSLVNAA